MALPTNLSTGDLIDEVWMDSVVTELTALPTRYAAIVNGTYTPTLVGMAIGTGGAINTASFTFVGLPAGGLLTLEGKVKFGTTGATLPGASAETISLPPGYTLIEATTAVLMTSSAHFFDVSTSFSYFGALWPNSSTTVRPVTTSVSGSFLAAGDVSATTPFTWQVSDEIYYKFSARVTGP